MAVRLLKGIPIIGGMTGAIAEGIRKLSPILLDEVSVRVEGQPGASKQELYFLALAAANGVVRRFQPLIFVPFQLPPTAACIRIEYDAADHWVVATISYQVTTIGANVRTAPGPALDTDSPGFINQLAVYRGPQCDVVGGKFDFLEFDVGTPGVPGTLKQIPPNLPFANQVILTSCPTTKEPKPGPITNAPPANQPVNSANVIPSPNPKPPGDNRSRGAVVTDSSVIPGAAAAIVVGGVTGGSIAGGVAPGATGTVGVSGSTTTAPPSSASCCLKTMQLVQLVFAALTDPGSASDETWVPPVQGPSGG